MVYRSLLLLPFWHSGALAWKLAISSTDNADGSACHPSSATTHRRISCSCLAPGLLPCMSCWAIWSDLITAVWNSRPPTVQPLAI
ncbi:hypothetical protein F5883DRAFT_69241 [Diaporthe sp. PMI_573]|nr:hypothetical protein F5883DRAFT_69241 [Diaporthaceae sp. PMI_573]